MHSQTAARRWKSGINWAPQSHLARAVSVPQGISSFPTWRFMGSGVISPLSRVISIVTLLITLLITYNYP